MLLRTPNVKLQLDRAGRASTSVSLWALKHLFFCEMAVTFSNVPFWVTFVILKNCLENWLANEVRDRRGTKAVSKLSPSFYTPWPLRIGGHKRHKKTLWPNSLCDMNRISPLGTLPPQSSSPAPLSGSVIGDRVKSRLENGTELFREGPRSRGRCRCPDLSGILGGSEMSPRLRGWIKDWFWFARLQFDP